MKNLKNIWKIICRVKGLKYIVVTVIAFVLIGFVDENSVWHHIQNKQRIGELEEEIQENLAIHERNNAQLRELNTNPHAIRKIARERYFMKADDEDIFVLNDDYKPQTTDETAE
jgi:cell division protein FtsB